MSIPLPHESGTCPDGDLRMLTRLALSQALRELIELSMELVPTFGEDGLQPGAYVAVSRRIGILHKRVRVLSVLTERIVLGAPWAVIDRRLGYQDGKAEEIFAEFEERWRAGDPAPWSPAVDGDEASENSYPLFINNPAMLAAALDRFCLRHISRDPHDRGRPRELRMPVSSGLPR